MLRSLIFSGLLTACAALALTAQAQELPRTASGKPDLQGIWQVNGRVGHDLEAHPARHDMPASLGIVTDGAIPYLPAALLQKQANFTDRAALDPLNRCWLPGMPRAMLLDSPFQIFQTDTEVAMTFEWQQVFRLIYTNGESSLYEGIESWMGHSRGQWEGDVLVVTVKDFNDRSWLDAAGNFHSAMLQLTERYQLIDADTISYEVTLEDPATFSKPWTIKAELQRQTDKPRVLENQCQAEKEELSGDFERDERSWYPAPIPADNVPFNPTAATELPLPAVGADIVRLANGKPDLSGYFSSDAGGANYGLEDTQGGFLTPDARGVVKVPTTGILPYQQWARAERVAREQPHRGYDDPTAHCFVAGIPRSLYVPSPFHIIQTDDFIVFLHERMSWRQIALNRSEHLPDAVRLWQGDSIGRWEGDTLVVETKNFNGKGWHNEVGDVMSHMQTIVETFTPVSATQVTYRATVSDPIPYTQPWTIELPLNRMDDELLEVACLEDNNDLQHLKDVRDEYRAAQAAGTN
ncbi:MAG: hypothetical protein V4603_09465 [Pseudomonadota bacterium]